MEKKETEKISLNSKINQNKDIAITELSRFILDFSQNGIEKLNQLILDAQNPELKNLKELYLNDNHITEIEENFFENFYPLLILDLSNNRFKNLHNFYGLECLEELYLQGNQISYLDLNTFTSCRKLLILDLSDNQLSHFIDFHNNQMSSIPCLRELYLKSNKIESIEFGSKSKAFPSLVILDLSHNQLEYLREEWFYYMPCLKQLNLEGNRITQIIDKPTLSLYSLALINLGNQLSSQETFSKHFYSKYSLEFFSFATDESRDGDNFDCVLSTLEPIEKFSEYNANSWKFFIHKTDLVFHPKSKIISGRNKLLKNVKKTYRVLI